MGKLNGLRSLGKHRQRRDYNIKIELKIDWMRNCRHN
jgi:hypothetical protein